MKTYKSITLMIVLMLITNSILAQTKLVIDDTIGFLTEEIEEGLQTKLADEGIEYTSMVDFKNKCDYRFAEIKNIEGELVLRMKDCKDRLMGDKNLGRRIFTVSLDEQVILLHYAVVDLWDREPMENVVIVEKQDDNKVETDTAVEDTNVVTEDTLYEGLLNEHSTRHFFSPSSYNLRQGELYYNTLYFLVHDIQYGITDEFSMGMGTTVGGIPFYLTPKVTIPAGDNLHFAVGDLFVLGTYNVDFVGNLLYTTMTHGPETRNTTIGLAYLGISDGDLTGKTNSLVINLSGMARMSEYMYFITENYFLGLNTKQYAYYDYYNVNTDEYIYYNEEYNRNDQVFAGITGFRFISKKKDVVSFQAGLTYAFIFIGDIPSEYTGPNWYGNNDDNSTFVFPTISYTRKFGKKY